MASADANPSPGDSAGDSADGGGWTPAQKQELIAHLDARSRLRSTDARLSLPTPQRLLLGAGSAFLVGLTLGGSYGFRSAGLRYRAENAHRLPREATGWYLYHKSKNYQMLLGGVKEGVRMGGRVAGWVVLFLGVEEVWDVVRGRRDAGNTVMASATVAGSFSLWSKLFPLAVSLVCFRVGFWRSVVVFAGGMGSRGKEGFHLSSVT